MKEHPSIAKMWNNYIQSINETPNTTNKTYEAWHFCYEEKDANELAALVLEGTKRATASLHYGYEYNDETLPELGCFSIITDFYGVAKCIIKTKKINITPFNEVSEEFAAIEGEGDKSLQYWRNTHLKFFSAEMKEYGSEFQEDMFVVCEEFEVVYK